MYKDAADMYNCLMSGAHLIYDYNEFSNLLRQPINVQGKVPRKFTPRTLHENASLHEQKQYSAKYKENRIA